MTIVITVAATLAAVFLLVGVHQAGIRKGTTDTLDELRRAVRVAGLQGSVTYAGGPPMSAN